MAGIARSVVAHGWPTVIPAALLSGGETTVTIGRGLAGRGGRNTDFLLGFALAAAGEPGIWAVAGDSDGIDGKEDATGAIVTPDNHAQVHAAIQALEKAVGHPIGILLDLQGPKIRVGTIKGGRMTVEAGERIRFMLAGAEVGKMSIPLPHPEIFAAIDLEDHLLIDDGRVRVRVTGPSSESIIAEITGPGL